MASTIQEVLRPLFVMCFIIGIGVYPTKQSKPEIRRIVYLSILYSLITWFAYGYLLYYTITMFTLKELYRSIISAVVLKINIVITITSVVASFSYQKRLKMCMKKLTIVDDTLEKLGTPKMYRKMHILSKRVVIGWIIYSLAINFYETRLWIYRKETSSWGLLIPHILNHCVHINTFVDLLFIIFLWHLHLELCRIAHELNLMFGTQMTFEMASHLLYITALCYSLYLTWKYQIKMSIYNPNLYIIEHVIARVLIYFIRFCAINLMCENVSIKANKISIVIHQLTNILRYADALKEICQFDLQIVQHPLRFNGMGLFRFGNVFIQKFFTTFFNNYLIIYSNKFCTTVLMFVIITAQMKMYIRS